MHHLLKSSQNAIAAGAALLAIGVASSSLAESTERPTRRSSAQPNWHQLWNELEAGPSTSKNLTTLVRPTSRLAEAETPKHAKPHVAHWHASDNSDGAESRIALVAFNHDESCEVCAAARQAAGQNSRLPSKDPNVSSRRQAPRMAERTEAEHEMPVADHNLSAQLAREGAVRDSDSRNISSRRRVPKPEPQLGASSPTLNRDRNLPSPLARRSQPQSPFAPPSPGNKPVVPARGQNAVPFTERNNVATATTSAQTNQQPNSNDKFAAPSLLSPLFRGDAASPSLQSRRESPLNLDARRADPNGQVATSNANATKPRLSEMSTPLAANRALLDSTSRAVSSRRQVPDSEKQVEFQPRMQQRDNSMPLAVSRRNEVPNHLPSQSPVASSVNPARRQSVSPNVGRNDVALSTNSTRPDPLANSNAPVTPPSLLSSSVSSNSVTPSLQARRELTPTSGTPKARPTKQIAATNAQSPKPFNALAPGSAIRSNDVDRDLALPLLSAAASSSNRPLAVSKPRPTNTLHATRLVGNIQIAPATFHRLRASDQIARVDIADRQICTVFNQASHEIDLVAKRAGETTVTVHYATSRTPDTYAIKVGAETRGPAEDDEESRLKKLLAEMFPDSDISLAPKDRSLVVTGTARSDHEAIRIVSFVRSLRLIPVVDQLQVQR